MSLEIDIRSATSGDPAQLTQAIQEALASGRVNTQSWVDGQGNRHLRLDVAPPSRDPER